MWSTTSFDQAATPIIPGNDLHRPGLEPGRFSFNWRAGHPWWNDSSGPWRRSTGSEHNHSMSVGFAGDPPGPQPGNPPAWGVVCITAGMDVKSFRAAPRPTRDKPIGHIGHIGQLSDLDGTDGTDVVCSPRPQSVRNVIFPASNVVELVEIVLCKQQVTGSSPVRSIQIHDPAFGHAGGGVSSPNECLDRCRRDGLHLISPASA